MKRPLKRKLATLLCFLMAISLYTSVFVYIDSYSYPVWEQANNIGSIAMRIQGNGVDQALDEIAGTRYITKAGLVKTAYAYLRMDKNDIYHGSPTDPEDPMFLVEGNAYSLSSDFIEFFPDEFSIMRGRYPQNSSEIAISITDAVYWGIPIGREMNYTHILNGVKRTVFVVGIFALSTVDKIRYVTTDAIAIVTPDVLNPQSTESLVYVDIDRSIISPVNPTSSLDLLFGIEGSIKSINPINITSSTFYIEDYLAVGIESYIGTITFEKTRQITRLQLVFLLSGVLAFVAVRFNITERRDIISYQKMRGSSKRRILLSSMSELWILSIAGGIVSLFVSPVLSRVGWFSTDYLDFNMGGNSSPLLVSFDTFLILGISVIIIPILGYIAHATVKTRTEDEFEHRRLARIMNNLRLIRWDVTIYGIIGILILILNIGGQSISENPALLIIASLIPIPLFIAVASISSKAIVVLSRPISRAFKPLLGKVPTSAGMRNVSHNDQLAIPIILILTIIFSSSLASNAVATSLPNTHIAQTRFLIGGDLSFRLDNAAALEWNNFSRAVLNDENISATAFISIGYLSLSEGAQGAVEFVAIKPEQYSRVGYTQIGQTLDSSDQMSLLSALEANPEGAILTNDIASEYNFIPGDTLRVFSIGDESLTAEFNIVGTTNAISRPRIIGQASSDSIIGTRKIWLNRNYVEDLINLNATTETYLCARAIGGSNTTDIGEKQSAVYGAAIRGSDQWSSTTMEMIAFTKGAEYSIDRSLDSIVTIGMTICIIIVFSIFQFNRQRIDRENQAILRTLGAPKGLILRVRIAEVLALVVLSLFFVFLFSLIDVSNILYAGIREYSTWNYSFPVEILASINWYSYLVVFVALVLPSIFLILTLAANYTDDTIAATLEEIEVDRMNTHNGVDV